ncbi:hypothetical protein AGMMS49921_11330 [Endomicrobiia bacterium]|nr:hypothetical protein AGMMS49921_11330 [Endomicrobiia bacterium]
MDLVLMGVKKAFDKRVRIARKEEKKRKEEKGKDRASRQAKQIQDLQNSKTKYIQTHCPKKEIKEALIDKRR